MTATELYRPIPTARWPEEIAAFETGFAGALNVYRTMAHHPALLRAWADLREHIVNRSALGPERLEVVILRAAHRLRSSYEWSQHVERARQQGFDDARILSLRGPLGAMRPDDALLAEAVDALMTDATLPEPLLARLTDAVGPKGVLDLMATLGFYSTLGFLLNSCDTPLDDDIRARLDARPLGDGPRPAPINPENGKT